MKNGQLLADLVEEIGRTLQAAKGMDRIKALAERTETVLSQWQTAAKHLTETIMGPNLLMGFAHACPLMQVTGDVVMAWMLLWRSVVAVQKLQGKVKKKDAAFYEGQIKTAEHFIRTVLPTTCGTAAAVMDTCAAAVEMPDNGFGGR